MSDSSVSSSGGTGDDDNGENDRKRKWTNLNASCDSNDQCSAEKKKKKGSQTNKGADGPSCSRQNLPSATTGAGPSTSLNQTTLSHDYQKHMGKKEREKTQVKIHRKRSQQGQESTGSSTSKRKPPHGIRKDRPSQLPFSSHQNEVNRNRSSPPVFDGVEQDVAPHVPPERILQTAGPAFAMTDPPLSEDVDNSLTIPRTLDLAAHTTSRLPAAPNSQQENVREYAKRRPVDNEPSRPLASENTQQPEMISVTGMATLTEPSTEPQDFRIVFRCDGRDCIHGQPTERLEIWRLIPAQRQQNIEAGGRENRAFSNHIGYRGRAEARLCHDCRNMLRGPTETCPDCGRNVCEMCLQSHQCRRCH